MNKNKDDQLLNDIITGRPHQSTWDDNWDPKWATPEDLKSSDDEMVCTCFGVSVGDVKQMVNEDLSIREMQEERSIGLSCGMCQTRFKYLVEEFRKNKTK